MVFSSTVFLFAFLPLFLVVYFAVPGRWLKNITILVFSLIFYAWGEPVYVWLMIGSILLNWLFALLINSVSIKWVKNVFLILVLAGDLLILGFYKYQGFLASTVNQALGEEFLAELDLALPIGISFFTLQAITYVVDVYRKKVKVQKNPLYVGMYISMFPQLVAGPIVRYADIEYAIDHRSVTLKGFSQGLRLFCIGLGKKVLLANTAGVLADSLLVRSAREIGAIGCFSGVAAYTFQIYYDFSGYSDMAIGLGKMLGFDYPRNFNYPYISRSVTEFWRRWHMSLGGFFRDYVYIPLGGNRVSKPRWLVNIIIVWSLTGIWHGAAWNFLLWGLYYGILLIFEKIFLLKVLKRVPRVFSHLWCIVTFFFGWLLFSVSGLNNVSEWFIALFGAYGLTGETSLWELQSWSYVSLIPILVIGATPVFPWLRKAVEAWAQGGSIRGIVGAPEKGNDFAPSCVLYVPLEGPRDRRVIAHIISLISDLSLISIFVLSCFMISSGGYNPFIYFQF